MPEMTTWIALLLGVNVSGHNLLPMAELRALLSELGHARVQTYIQSGNGVFRSREASREKIAQEMVIALEKKFGFAPSVMLLTADEMLAAMEANPFPECDPKRVHFFFLGEVPAAPDLEKLTGLASQGETFTLKDQVFYLYAPEGVGKSKLAPRVEGALGVPATARNLNTVQAIVKMV